MFLRTIHRFCVSILPQKHVWNYIDTSQRIHNLVNGPITKVNMTEHRSDMSDSHTHSQSASDKVVQLISSSQEEGWQQQVESACRSLKNNNLIAVPTDTIYGIAGLSQCTEAIKKIYKVKGRQTSKPIAICVGDVSDIPKWAKVTVSQQLLADLLPGPVTAVFERTVALNPSLNPGTSLVGVRVPDYDFIRAVASTCGEPLALTSANISNNGSTLTVQEFSDLWPDLGLIFDGGTLGTSATSRLGSTVVDLSKAGSFTIIREGSACDKTTERLKKYGLKEDTKS